MHPFSPEAAQLIDEQYELIQAFVQHRETHARMVMQLGGKAPDRDRSISFRDFQEQWVSIH